MTLSRQLTTSIVILLTAVFSGTALINFDHMKTLLESQLQNHAQDTATSLGLSLSPHILDADLSVSTAMIDAVFDRGYFMSIRLIDLNGNVLLDRTRRNVKPEVPAWFASLVSIRVPTAEALVMSRWKQVGTIYVESHPGAAYRELWQNSLDIFILYIVSGIVILTVASLSVRFLLRPLREVVKQADAISSRSCILQSRLPKSPEMRSVVTAMNNLSARLENIFAEQSENTEFLRKQIYLDEVTALGNRKYLERQADSLLNTVEGASHGALFLLQLGSLKVINSVSGHDAGDRLLQETAAILNCHAAGRDNSYAARLEGGLFGLIISDIDHHDAEVIAADICDSLRLLQREFNQLTGYFSHIGISFWTNGNSLSTIVDEADDALRTLDPGTAIDIRIFDKNSKADTSRSLYWKQMIHSAVETKDILLFTQGVYPSAGADPVDKEVLLRIPVANGNIANAGQFMPLINHNDDSLNLDKLVIETLLKYLIEHTCSENYTVNISNASLSNPDFLDWLCKILSGTPRLARRLQIEVSESGVISALDSAKLLADRLSAAGCRMGIDHFGRSFHPFGYLSSINTSHIKIDSYFTNKIENSSDNQFFIKSLRDAVHSLGIRIIAQSIDDSEAYSVMNSLGLDGYQGNYLGKPVPLLG